MKAEYKKQRENKECFTCGETTHFTNKCLQKGKDTWSDSNKKAPKSNTLAAAMAVCSPGSSLSTAIEIRAKDRSWKELTALVDSGAELNFILQMAVKEAAFNESDIAMKVVTTLDGHTLLVYGEHDVLTRIANTMGNVTERSNHFYSVDIQRYDTILGYPWLQAHNPEVDWATGTWSYTTRSEPSEVTDITTFCTAAAQTGCMYAVRYQPTGPTITMVSLPDLPPKYQDFRDVLSEEVASQLPPHGPHDYAIEIEGSSLPYGPIYNLSERELKVLREYLQDSL